MRDEMDDQQLVEIRQLLHYTYGVTKQGQEALEIARRLMREVDVLRGNRDRLRVREAALVEIVEAVAQVEPYYSEQPEGYFCVMCDGWQTEAWQRGQVSAKERFKHDDDCPVTKARALLAPGAQAVEGEA